MNNLEEATHRLQCMVDFNTGTFTDIKEVITLLRSELDRQRDARQMLERAKIGASCCNVDGTGKRRAEAAMRAYDYALGFFPVEVKKPDPLRLWREMGAW